jgi:hypothetical protein
MVASSQFNTERAVPGTSKFGQRAQLVDQCRPQNDRKQQQPEEDHQIRDQAGEQTGDFERDARLTAGLSG